MASTNIKRQVEELRTVAGGIASRSTNHEKLVRMCSATLLWEDSPTINGKKIADEIGDLINKCDFYFVAHTILIVKHKFNNRHLPLFMAVRLLKHPQLPAIRMTDPTILSKIIKSVITRADELAEIVSIYWNGGRVPLANQLRQGIKGAFGKFKRFDFAKYNRTNKVVTLRDVMYMCHVRPEGSSGKYTKEDRRLERREQGGFPRVLTSSEQVFRDLSTDNLGTAKTVMSAITASDDETKAKQYTELLDEKKMSALGFVRNIRNMEECGVDADKMLEYSKSVNLDKLNPFDIVQAADLCPRFEVMLLNMMLRSVSSVRKFTGRTLLIIDVSGSMDAKLSGAGRIKRLDVACLFAMIMRACCDDITIYATAGSDARRQHATMLIPNRDGFGLFDALVNSRNVIGGGGIFMYQVMKFISDKEKKPFDRTIVITDEEDVDHINSPDNADVVSDNNIIINVGNNRQGIAYTKWDHIHGWSKTVLDYIHSVEDGVYTVGKDVDFKPMVMQLLEEYK